MPKKQRPDRYPIKIMMKHVGKGKTAPDKGEHFVADNSDFMIGTYGDIQLKYWLIDGKMVKDNPLTLHITDKDVMIEAFFGAKKIKKESFEVAEGLITKDISASSGIKVSHEKNSGKRKRRSL